MVERRRDAGAVSSDQLFRTKRGFIGADDYRHHMVGINAARERIADIGKRNLLDVGHEIVKIRQRQSIETDCTEIIENLAVAVDAQCKTAEDILLRLLLFIRGRSLVEEFLDRLARVHE